MQVEDDVVVTHEQDTISEITMIPGNARSGTVLKHGSLAWYLLDRRGDYYIRLVDEQHPYLAAFDGIDRFPIDKKWKVETEFKPFEKPKPITVTDILNEGMPDTIYGMLEFSIDGEKYSLAPLNHPDKDDKFFIIFGIKPTANRLTEAGDISIYQRPMRITLPISTSINHTIHPACLQNMQHAHYHRPKTNWT